MDSMVNYLLESGISLSLFALMYFLIMRKDTFFRTNRLFLLTSVVFSLILPLLKIPVFAPDPASLPEVTVTPYRNLLDTVIVSSHRLTGSVEKYVVSSKMLVNFWITGVLMMALIFLVRIFQVVLIIRKGRVLEELGYRLVLNNKVISPFSFLNYLFVSEEHMRITGYESMVKHELEHIRQGHTIDIMILDILLIFQWFNPLIWLLKRAIRENHEYLVDRVVLGSGVSPVEYKQLLLSQVAGNQIYAAHHFNYSLLKNRFKMMTKIPSPKIAGIKIITGVLIALALVVVFACEQKKKTPASSTGKTDTLTIDPKDGGFVIAGNPEELKKMSELLLAGKYDITTREQNGSSYLLLKVKEREADSVATKEISPDEKLAATDKVFVVVDKMPEFPGGTDALLNYIGKSVNYPKEASEKAIQGKVIISFVITKDGTVKDAKVLRGVAPVLDNEAIRVVNALPRWIPGEQGGKPVNVQYTIPINFVLQ